MNSVGLYNEKNTTQTMQKVKHQHEPLWTGKQACSIKLAAYPPMLPEIFERLKAAGVKASCLFGGAVRDADLGALWGAPRSIKDYDLRCWMGSSFMLRASWEPDLGLALMRVFEGSSMEMSKSVGTERLRHVLRWRGLELDISARSSPSGSCDTADCAKERALDSDASLSAVSIDSELHGWCEALYAADRVARRVSYYPGVEPSRMGAYRERMRAKFPSLPERFMTGSEPMDRSGDKK